MIYSEHALPASAQDHGICLWRFAVEPHDPPHFTHVIPPDGTVLLSVSSFPGQPPRLGIAGPSMRAHLVPAVHGLSVAGVRLQPGAAPALLGIAADILVDRLHPWSPDARQTPLAQALAGLALSEDAAPQAAEAFAAFVAGSPPRDPLVASAARQILDASSVVQIGLLAQGTSLGPQQLRRRFKAATGLSPKAFAQIHRLRGACLLALANPVSSWADVAAEAGYADQAHFNRAVARTFGVTPTALLGYLAGIRHAFMPPAP